MKKTSNGVMPTKTHGQYNHLHKYKMDELIKKPRLTYNEWVDGYHTLKTMEHIRRADIKKLQIQLTQLHQQAVEFKKQSNIIFDKKHDEKIKKEVQKI